jgi:hypothetical protein
MTKIKFPKATMVRKNMFAKELWLKGTSKKKNIRCENCGIYYAEVKGDIGMISGPSLPNKHICGECGDAYIAAGAEDLEAKAKTKRCRRETLIKKIRKIGYTVGFYEKRIEDRTIEELEKLHASQVQIKDRQNRIDKIVITEEESFMESYLEKDYGVIQDVEFLKSEEQIEGYFNDDYGDLFDCGQGYSQDKAKVIVKIANKFYEVTIFAEIGSAKQDRGDRLYWVESIKKVRWKEIPKPEPKEYTVYNYSFLINPDQKKILDIFLRENGFKPVEGGIGK